MEKYANKVVDQAKSWLGYNEADGSHKKIIDIYNAQKPLPVGYKVKYTDAWCATFVSAVAVTLGYTDIIPTECSCPRMIELLKKKGIWIENENRTPNPGDLIFYDWEDSGIGDNQGNADHVGIVEKVSENTITVIEGNYSKSVKRRTLAVNGKYIRGYGVPKYGAEQNPAVNKVAVETLRKGAKGNPVKALQALLIGYGYSCGSYGADGSFGSATEKALLAFQKGNGLDADGICGPATWTKLLGG